MSPVMAGVWQLRQTPDYRSNGTAVRASAGRYSPLLYRALKAEIYRCADAFG